MIHLSTEDFSISPISSRWFIPANMPASPAGDARSEAGQGRPFLGTWLTGNSRPTGLKVRQPWTYKSSRADHFLRCGSRSAGKGQVRHRTRGTPLGPALSAGPKNQLLQFEQVGFSPSPEAGSTSQPHPVVLLAAVHFSGGRNSLVNFDGVRQVVQGASRNKAQCRPTAHAEFTTPASARVSGAGRCDRWELSAVAKGWKRDSRQTRRQSYSPSAPGSFPGLSSPPAE
jgi:hypothetical protein